MDRLTGRKENGQAYIIGCPDFEIPKIIGLIIQNVVDKCAAYEDLDLEPWEMERICDAYGHGLSLRTESALRLQMIREIPTDRLQDLVHENAWVSALVYDLYMLLLAVDKGIREKDLSILRPPSRPGAPENGIPFQRKLGKLETEYEELLHSCCRYMERKRKNVGVKKEE